MASSRLIPKRREFTANPGEVISSRSKENRKELGGKNLDRFVCCHPRDMDWAFPLAANPCARRSSQHDSVVSFWLAAGNPGAAPDPPRRSSAYYPRPAPMDFRSGDWARPRKDRDRKKVGSHRAANHKHRLMTAIRADFNRPGIRRGGDDGNQVLVRSEMESDAPAV